MSDDPPLYRATLRDLHLPPGGRHRLDDEATARTLEMPAVTQPQIDVHIYEPTDPRLKRHVVHDERSRNYALPEGAKPTQPISWTRNGPVLDQGEVGSCTANAALGLMMTTPFSSGKTFTEDDALAFYHQETVLDDSEIPGEYPPDDTGSSGLWAMKTLQQQGLISGYSHAFSLNAALTALQNGPIAVGSVWVDSMMDPGKDGTLTVNKRSQVDGGHEYVVDGYDPTRDAVRMTNSWGTSWGINGQAWIKTVDFQWLLSQEGDVVQPTVSAPAPGPVNPQPTPGSDNATQALQQIKAIVDAALGV